MYDHSRLLRGPLNVLLFLRPSLLSTKKQETSGRAQESAHCDDREVLLRTCASRLMVPAFLRTGHPFAA
jgi:hypothetical protein